MTQVKACERRVYRATVLGRMAKEMEHGVPRCSGTALAHSKVMALPSAMTNK